MTTDVDILVSPCCKDALQGWKEKRLWCSSCGQSFPTVGETWDLVPQEYRKDRRVRAWGRVHERYVARNRETAAPDSTRRAIYVAYHQEFLQQFCRLRGRVLDVGCGFMLEHLDFLDSGTREELEYVGLDPEASFVGGARKMARLFRGVGEYLPFATGSFDAVFMISVLDHVILPDRVLAEVCRVMVPEGRFFSSLPMREIDWRTRVKEVFGIGRDLRHVNEFDEARLRKALDRAGLRVVEQQRSRESPKNLFVEAVVR